MSFLLEILGHPAFMGASIVILGGTAIAVGYRHGDLRPHQGGGDPRFDRRAGDGMWPHGSHTTSARARRRPARSLTLVSGSADRRQTHPDEAKPSNSA